MADRTAPERPSAVLCRIDHRHLLHFGQKAVHEEGILRFVRAILSVERDNDLDQLRGILTEGSGRSGVTNPTT
jgi:hypothetical protein